MVVMVVDRVLSINVVGERYVDNVARQAVLHILMVCISVLVHCNKTYGSDRGHHMLSYDVLHIITPILKIYKNNIEVTRQDFL